MKTQSVSQFVIPSFKSNLVGKEQLRCYNEEKTYQMQYDNEHARIKQQFMLGIGFIATILSVGLLSKHFYKHHKI